MSKKAAKPDLHLVVDNSADPGAAQAAAADKGRIARAGGDAVRAW